MTRAQQRAAEFGGMNPPEDPSVPTLRPMDASPLTVISPSSDEKSELYDSEATESEPELPPSSYIDEETRLRIEEARLDEQLREMRSEVTKLRVLEKQQELLVVQAELEARRLRGTELPTLPVVAAPVVIVPPVVSDQGVDRTPPRAPYHLRPRVLAFQSTAGRKQPTAAAMSYQKAKEELPDAVPSAPVVLPLLIRVEEKRGGTPPVTLPREKAVVKPLVKPIQPVKFTGEDATQNERVDRWISTVNEWLHLAEIPADQELAWARPLISGTSSAGEWLAQKDDELAYSSKRMTWKWLQGQLIQHYGQPSGAMAMAAEWEALRMGTKNADGSETGGKATWTVAAYSSLFLHYLRALTTHSVMTEDLLVINRYVTGIKLGYEALYKVMLGVQKVLWYDNLQEAIEAAYQAEAAITVSRIEKRSATQPSSSPSTGGGSRFRGKRQTQDSLNGM